MSHRNSEIAGAGPTRVKSKSIARIASVVELRDVALKSAHGVLHASREAIPADWSQQTFIGYDTILELREAEASGFVVEASFIAVYKASWRNEVLAELPPLEPDDPPDIEVQATFELYYEMPNPDAAQEDLENFAVANGTLHAWPYWRELAQSVALRMRIPPLMIGVFKIPSAFDPAPQDETTDEGE